MKPTSRKRSGAASHVLIALVGVAAGMGMAWGMGGRPLSDAVTTHGEWVYLKKRGQTDSVRAYIAYPERKDRAPGVVVIHEVFGLTDWEPTVADKLAKNGYVAIVPDLLSTKYGRSPTDPDSGRKLVAQLEPSRITADLDATVDYLNEQSAVQSGIIGIMGFCWGGGQTFRYTTNNPKLKAAVICYGAPPPHDALARIETPLLGVYGENDARIDASLPDVAARLKGMGKPFTYQVYPGTGHGFLKPGREGSDGPQVEKAWTNILNFFKKELQPKSRTES